MSLKETEEAAIEAVNQYIASEVHQAAFLKGTNLEMREKNSLSVLAKNLQEFFSDLLRSLLEEPEASKTSNVEKEMDKYLIQPRRQHAQVYGYFM